MFDFGVGYSELFVLALIAVVVIGPKDLPKVLRTFGQFMRKARGMASEFQTHVDAAMKDSGLDDLKKEAQGLKSSMSSTLSAPNLMTDTAPQSSKQSNDFDAVFGTSPEAGETKVAGTQVAIDAAPKS
jgi:sec-independent protein translocase protein TatB